ncbi:unnamed protein product [Parascedosporium putredinis]|uniref:Erythromycin esterase n=1 Tax=Parascedosporium putredinis TaxID=1442378 RepID=A0A9P1H6T9_9PEZI|nr:unnamed protein product [Parascedosporium putredinis]CAI8000757.1 unnamed protein product [Parascedosporium putredinis]
MPSPKAENSQENVASTRKLLRPAIVEVPSTPSSSSPIKPPMSEMHPSKVHTTMAAPSSGLRLGFTDIRPSEKKGSPLPSGLTQVTPSKGSAMPSSPFTFTFTRQGTAADLGLSTRAQEMMNELREEAAKIKAELAAQRELEKAEEEANGGRRIAKPKGKSSRFSAVHMAEFKKMDSIENHPSAFRALRNQLTPVAGIKRTSSRANLDELASPITQRSGIKRTQSKARLDDPDTPATENQPLQALLSRAASLSTATPTPAKRFKQRLEDDASSSRPSSRDGSSIPRPKSSGVDAAGGLAARSRLRYQPEAEVVEASDRHADSKGNNQASELAFTSTVQHVDAVVSGATNGAGEVAYPDLSKFGTTSPAVNGDGKAGSMPPRRVSPTGFGGCAGQSSLRHVRPSILPMPGGFPNSVMDTGSKLVGGGANKENKSPTKFILPGISHGMKNKKRLRVSCDEEDAEREAAERAAKRKKNDHKAQISRTPGSQVLSRDSPIKRKPGISLSRLKMLSQPKSRT